jgi:(R,R)-butanediol dehydrogenase/meso-butanediol dehydrogenase/diacetyl reductase
MLIQSGNGCERRSILPFSRLKTLSRGVTEMKALVWHKQKKLIYQDFPDPTPPKANEVIIKIDWCGICGTDIEEYQHGPMYIPVDEPNPLTGVKAPLILGHEMVGTVSEVGPDVKRLKPGDIISPDPIIYCGTCPNCISHNTHHCDNMAHLGLTTHGGFAEYVKTIEDVCFKLPNSMPSEFGAMSEPTAVCVRAIRLAKIDIGHSVAIVGAGTIGLLALQLAKLSGAYPIYMVTRSAGLKTDLALKMGADEIIVTNETNAVEKLKDITCGSMVDRVIECGGTEAAMKLSVELCGKRGRVVMTGLHNKPIPINYFPIVWNEIEIVGSFSHIYDLDYKIATELIGRNMLDIQPLITSQISLQNVISHGIEEFITNSKKHVKIMVSPHLV